MTPDSGGSYMLNPLVLFIFGGVAWVLGATTSIFTILDAVALSNSGLSYVGLAIGAAVTDVLSLGATGVLLVFSIRKNQRVALMEGKRGLIVALCCISVSLLASSLTIAVLISLQRNRVGDWHVLLGSWVRQLPAQYSIWALSVLSLTGFYVVALIHFVRRNPKQGGAAAGAEGRGRDSVISVTREASPEMSLQTLSRPYLHEHLGATSTHSNASTQSLQSWRSSLQQVVRPVASRTKLIGRHSFSREPKNVFSDAHCIDDSSHNDGFDSWDTSGVDPTVKDSLMPPAVPLNLPPQPAPSKGTHLETIPGSRPVSPARALDGPFPVTTVAEADEILAAPRVFNDSPRTSSPSVDESHIHPLFRTDSPTPPPAVSSGTVLMASPMGGHVIPRPYGRQRSDSRTTSPSPLGEPQMKSEARIAPHPGLSRAVTPPIPQSILAERSEPER